MNPSGDKERMKEIMNATIDIIWSILQMKEPDQIELEHAECLLNVLYTYMSKGIQNKKKSLGKNEILGSNEGP